MNRQIYQAVEICSSCSEIIKEKLRPFCAESCYGSQYHSIVIYHGLGYLKIKQAHGYSMPFCNFIQVIGKAAAYTLDGRQINAYEPYSQLFCICIFEKDAYLFKNLLADLYDVTVSFGCLYKFNRRNIPDIRILQPRKGFCSFYLPCPDRIYRLKIYFKSVFGHRTLYGFFYIPLPLYILNHFFCKRKIITAIFGI